MYCCEKIETISGLNHPGLVFVVDSSDKERLIEAKEELFRIMNSDELRQVPVEIIANKQDLPGLRNCDSN